MDVMVFGSFDALHDGHRALFRQAKEHGKLTVVVARDDNISFFKNRKVRVPEIERLRVISEEPLVNQAILGCKEDLLSVIEEVRPKVILLGYDQRTFDEELLKKRLEERGLKPRILRGEAYKPEKLKSSILAKGL